MYASAVYYTSSPWVIRSRGIALLTPPLSVVFFSFFLPLLGHAMCQQLGRRGGAGRRHREGRAGDRQRPSRVRVGAPRDEEVPRPALRAAGIYVCILYVDRPIERLLFSLSETRPVRRGVTFLVFLSSFTPPPPWCVSSGVQERLELESLLHSLVAQDPTSCYAQLRAAVLRCNKIRNIPGTHQQMALENQVCELCQS